MSEIHPYDASVSEIKGFLEHVRQNKPDRAFCVPKVSKVQVMPPRRGAYKFKIEVEIPEEMITGDEEIRDFGGFTVLDLPKSRIDSNWLRD